MAGMVLTGGLDPGEAVTAWSLVEAGKLAGPCAVVAYGEIKRPSGVKLKAAGLEMLQRAQSGPYGASCLLVGVEGQWAPRLAGGGNRAQEAGKVNATLGVAANRGAWVALLEAEGVQAEVVHPSQWRRAIGRQVGRERKTWTRLAGEAGRLRGTARIPAATPRVTLLCLRFRGLEPARSWLAAARGSSAEPTPAGPGAKQALLPPEAVASFADYLFDRYAH